MSSCSVNKTLKHYLSAHNQYVAAKIALADAKQELLQQVSLQRHAERSKTFEINGVEPPVFITTMQVSRRPALSKKIVLECVDAIMSSGDTLLQFSAVHKAQFKQLIKKELTKNLQEKAKVVTNVYVRRRQKRRRPSNF